MPDVPPLRRYTDPAKDVAAERLRFAGEPVKQTTDRMMIYVIGVIVTSTLAGSSVLVITLLRPTQDNASLIASILGLFTPIVTALMAGIWIEMQRSVDGRMTDLLIAERAAARLQGRIDPRTPREGQQATTPPDTTT